MSYNHQINEISKRSQIFFAKFNKAWTNSRDCLSDRNYLNLLTDESSFAKSMPKNFIITTRNGSSAFNIDLLVETSTTISNFVKEIHPELKYDLDIEDPRNVLGKFEQLYQCQNVVFENEDIPTCCEITEKLFIVCCPNFMKPQSLNCQERFSNNWAYGRNDNQKIVEMRGLDNFLKKFEFQTFTIITNKNKYKCNIFCVYLSDVIKKQLEEDPTNKQYFYDFDDDYDEFKPFCDLFNFKKIEINKSNMDLFKEIAEDLQIQSIQEKVDKYINDSGKVTQTIDEQQTIIDSIDELFEWLFNIKEKSVKTVFNSIIESEWVQTEENVQELVAFISEVAKTDILLQSYLVDLIIELNEKSNDLKPLKILVPFLVKRLMNIINSGSKQYNNNWGSNNNGWGKSYTRGTNNSWSCKLFDNNDESNVCSFIYKLYKKGFIQKEELKKSLKNLCGNDSPKSVWFLTLTDIIPEFCKLKSNIYYQNKYYQIIEPYLPDKIDLYEQVLDSGEPSDLITKALRNDDVDTVQSILSKSHLNVKSLTIPFNPFDNFTNRINYLNYAAAFGSLKCFKYLLLNHSTVDNNTFEFAIFGGNNEIIKIVDQNRSPNVKNGKYSDNSCYNYFSNAILKHRNDLFDWLLEKDNNNIQNCIYNLASFSAFHGNIHSLAEIIFRGYDITNNFESIIQNTAKNGFYKLTKFLFKIYNERKKQNDKKRSNSFRFSFECAVCFGNLEIFKLFFNDFDLKNIDNSLCYSIDNDYMNIINFILDKISDSKHYVISNDFMLSILSASFKKEKSELFDYLLEKFKKMKQNLIFSSDFYMKLLVEACSSENFICITIITDIILNLDQNIDFSNAFIKSASLKSIKQCQYFLDKKVKINYDVLISNIESLGNLNVQIFSLVLKNINPKLKKLLLTCIQEAIRYHNKELVEYLFKEKAEFDDALIQAVETDDCELVDIVLKYVKKPYLINLIRKNGTALFCAVQNDNLEIVKKLLSFPGIDPSLSCYINGVKISPIEIAIENTQNLDIINAILDFYGDDIQNQKQLLNKAVKSVFHLYCQSNTRKTNIQIIDRILNIKGIDPNCFYCIPGDLRCYENFYNNDIMYNRDIDVDDDDVDVDEDLSENDNEFFNDDGNFNLNESNYKELFIGRNSCCLYSNPEEYNSDKVYMSFLSIACISDDVKMVEKLLKIDNINVNQYSMINGYTPLIFSIKSKLIEISKILIENPNTNINQRDFNGETALIIAVKYSMNEIVDLLIKCDRFDPEESLFDYSCCIAKWETLKLLISCKYFDINNIPISLLYTAVKNKDIEVVESIIKNPSFERYKSKNSIASEIVLSIRKNSFDIFKLLLNQVNNDVNLCDSKNVSLLVHAARNLNEQVLDYILNDEKFDSKKSDILTAFVEFYSNRKNNEFKEMNNNHIDIVALKRQRLEYLYEMKLQKYQRIEANLIEQQEQLDRLEINLQIEKNELQRLEMEREYINQQQRTNDDEIESQKSDMELKLKQKINKDIAMSQIIARKMNEQRNYLDNARSRLEQKFLMESERLNLAQNGNNNYNHYINNNNNEEEDKDDNDRNIEEKEEDKDDNDNEQKMNESCKFSIMTILNKLYDYDKSHENLIDFTKLLPNGESFFTVFTTDFEDIGKVSSFLLEHGADPNIPNVHKVYPLERAILIESYKLVLSLISSNKIDYSVKIKRYSVMEINDDNNNDNDYSNTYLHLAACSQFIGLFLSKNLIDINVTNDVGNTPLMEACASNMTLFIDSFFKYDNLDYLHRNKEGKDAYDLLKVHYQSLNDGKQDENENEVQINDKKSYLNRLKALCMKNPWGIHFINNNH